MDFDTASVLPCLVLLGEPGIGKPTAIRSERAAVEAQAGISGDRLVWCDLKEYGDAGDLRNAIFDAATWRTWTADGSTLHLFLDSLDECRLMIKNVGAILAGVFRNQQANLSRLRLRVACRTAVWPTNLESTLVSLRGKEKAGCFELAPLREEHIAVMTREHGEKPERSLREIASAGVEAFAQWPVTLDFLWKLYRGGQRLPHDQVDLYQQGCLLLATEMSASRRDAG